MTSSSDASDAPDDLDTHSVNHQPLPWSSRLHLCEGVRHSGWLLHSHRRGHTTVWTKRWVRMYYYYSRPPPPSQFYLLNDRLCYTTPPSCPTAPTRVRYWPLDRIPVRPLPRGYAPAPGIAAVRDRQVEQRGPFFGRHCWGRGCVFSLQCGRETHYLAAPTAWQAKVVL